MNSKRNYFYQNKYHFKNSYFPYKKTYYKNHKKIINLNNDNFIKEKSEISHNKEIICFMKCSKWLLNLSTLHSNQSNKLNINGFIEDKNINFNKLKNIKFTNNLTDFFPIDMKDIQKFVLKKEHSKICLNISFDLEKNSNFENFPFFKINRNFSINSFNINLNSVLTHDETIKIFKEDVNFFVKGIDILEIIHKKLINLNLEEIIKNSSENYIFNQIVFNNFLLCFGISFEISKIDLISFLKSNYNGKFALFDYNIKIIKIYINYTLPLISFSKLKISQSTIQILPKKNILNNNNNNDNNKLLYLNNLYLSSIPFNFCNFHCFLSNTTPIIFETDDLKIKNIFNIFKKYSLYGINCLYKIENIKFMNITYFPILNNVYINVNYNNINNINNNNNINNFYSNNNSTLDGSFNSNSKEDKSFYNNNNKKIYFHEFNSEIFKLKSFNEQLLNLLKIYPEIEDLELNDINNDSYFSILWTPVIIDQNKYNEKIGNINFEVFYTFKSNYSKNSAHHMNIIGIKEKNFFGNEIDNENEIPYFNSFWFLNQNNLISFNNNINNNSFFIQQKQNEFLILNKKYFNFLKYNLDIYEDI